jgi:hypothetical protein
MRFLHKQFQAKKKEIIEVTIDRTTKVKFMTALEFKSYKNARTHSYYGGTFEAGTIRFVLPFDAIWNVVVEKGAYHAPIDVRASARLIPPDREVLSTVALDAPASATQRLIPEPEEAQQVDES